jgi:hypothetical protein
VPYAPDLVQEVKKAPKTLGNQLARYAVHLDFSVYRISKVTGASRQTVYNWFRGGEVFGAYQPIVQALLKILQNSTSADQAWRKACKAFDLPA